MAGKQAKVLSDKAVKDLLLLVCRYTDPGILHHELDKRLLARRRQLFSPKSYSARMGKFDGVGEQVTKYLVEPGLIGQEFRLQVLIDVYQE